MEDGASKKEVFSVLFFILNCPFRTAVLYNIAKLCSSWWQKHSVAAAFGALAAVVSLAIGGWMVWRRRLRELGSYEPVGAVVPEQELQTL